jgi:hypothetical protein
MTAQNSSQIGDTSMKEKPISSPMNKCDATIVTKTKSSQKTNCDHSGVFDDVNVTLLITTSLLVSFGDFQVCWHFREFYSFENWCLKRLHASPSQSAAWRARVDHVLRTPAPTCGRTGVSVVDPPVPQPLRILLPRYEPRPGAHLRPAAGPAGHVPARGPTMLRDRACKGPAGPQGLKASAATSSTSSICAPLAQLVVLVPPQHVRHRSASWTGLSQANSAVLPSVSHPFRPSPFTGHYQHHCTVAQPLDSAVAAQARLQQTGQSRAGASTRRGRLRSDLLPWSVKGEPPSIPSPSPGHLQPRTAAGDLLAAGGDYTASCKFFPGRFMQRKGPFVILKIWTRVPL